MHMAVSAQSVVFMPLPSVFKFYSDVCKEVNHSIRLGTFSHGREGKHFSLY